MLKFYTRWIIKHREFLNIKFPVSLTSNRYQVCAADKVQERTDVDVRSVQAVHHVAWKKEEEKDEKDALAVLLHTPESEEEKMAATARVSSKV